jgi:hypothetical protein
MYGGIAVAALIVGIIFYLTFRHLDRTEEKDNAIGIGARACVAPTYF